MSTERITLPIAGMSCQHCVQRVKDALEDVEGVTSAAVNLDEEQAVVACVETVTRDDLAEAVAEAGYSVPTAA